MKFLKLLRPIFIAETKQRILFFGKMIALLAAQNYEYICLNVMKMDYLCGHFGYFPHVLILLPESNKMLVQRLRKRQISWL